MLSSLFILTILSRKQSPAERASRLLQISLRIPHRQGQIKQEAMQMTDAGNEAGRCRMETPKEHERTRKDPQKAKRRHSEKESRIRD
jgi:hypothetical protein